MTSGLTSEIRRYTPGQPSARNLWFLVLWILSLVAFHVTLIDLTGLALRDERYQHIALVPIISLWSIWLSRARILSTSRYSPAAGIPLLFAGIGLAVVYGRLQADGSYERLVIMAVAMILVWIAIAVMCYGTQAICTDMFPWLFLLLIVPLPASIMDVAAAALQKESADMTAGLFGLVRMPFIREGFSFSLPNVQIYIAEECSGIHSSLSLLISGMLAGHLVLRSGWSQTCFALVIVPVAIFKNAVRITTISWLGVYVDHGFFSGYLHRYGGLPFSLLAISILIPILVLLRKLERSHTKRSVQ